VLLHPTVALCLEGCAASLANLTIGCVAVVNVSVVVGSGDDGGGERGSDGGGGMRYVVCVDDVRAGERALAMMV
jgi:hypothetical protein